MHKTVIYNTGETIRFRRWSGKGYAIFRSLHRHVTIGRVCKSIADSALSKDKNTMNLGGGGSDTRTQKEEEAQPPEGSPELLSILFSLSASGLSAAMKLTNIPEVPATYSHLFVIHTSGVTKEPHHIHTDAHGFSSSLRSFYTYLL
ncbi:hypothetical protein [Paraprevotella xylaniphila]|uniref:hypothetical protein n=1 Tax=Paraprevotella xylaniphila TaxID=454155 RepID=UPI00266DCA51|nr:hypothetical protein [Paraprevotella xylaniphila]